jgi:hypothetical protein
MTLEPLTCDHYPRLTPFFARQPHRLSAYSLPSIIAWQTCYFQPQFLVDGDWLVVAAEFFKHREKRHLLLPLCPGRVPEPDRLYGLARRLGFDTYWFVPQDYVAHQGMAVLERYFTVGEQDGFHDYLYRRRDLAELPGRRFHKKRNLISQFTEAYVQTGRSRLEPIRPEDVPDCIAFLDRWCQQRDCGVEDEEDDLSCEKLAAVNALENLARVEGSGLLVRVDGTVSAMAVAGPLTEEMGVLMFEKAFGDIKGLYQYLDQACARLLFDGKTLVNKESDMSLPGLAQAKRSYHPVEMVKSFALTLK